MNTLQEQMKAKWPEYEFLVRSGEIVDVIAPMCPYVILPRGMELVTQTALEASCEYCQSLHAMSRCPSCGAPRRGKKADNRVFPECLHPELP